MSDNLLLENNGRMLVATFNRPEDNKVSDGMARELSAALATAHETSEMVLLKSAGPDFCTGRLRDPDAGPPHPEAYSRRPEYDSSFTAIRRSATRRSPWSALSKAAAWASARLRPLAAMSLSPAATHASTSPR